jgi:hypothetical protein
VNRLNIHILEMRLNNIGAPLVLDPTFRTYFLLFKELSAPLMTKNRPKFTFLSHLLKTDSNKGHLAAQFTFDFQIKHLLFDSGGRNQWNIDHF